MGSFSASLGAFRNKVLTRYDLFVRKVVFDVGTSLVYKSPVGDGNYWLRPPPKGYVGGRFRANWQLSVGSINFTTTDNVDPSGQLTISSFQDTASQASGGNVYYYTNSLPYAKPIENGHSRQAPHGVVRITVVEWQDFVDNALRTMQ